MYEQSGYVNTEHKICPLSNSGIKMEIWGFWLWCQNSSLDFQLFLPHFSQRISSYNPGTGVSVLSPVGDWLAMSSGVRFTAVWARWPPLPWNIPSRGEPPQASWHCSFEFEAFAGWLQASVYRSRRRRRQMRGHDVVHPSWSRWDWSAVATFELARFTLKARVNDEKLWLSACSSSMWGEIIVCVWGGDRNAPKN